MGLQATTKNNIITIHGNGLAVFLLDDNKLYLKDSNGKVGHWLFSLYCDILL
jgi:hypothetical protein